MVGVFCLAHAFSCSHLNVSEEPFFRLLAQLKASGRPFPGEAARQPIRSLSLSNLEPTHVSAFHFSTAHVFFSKSAGSPTLFQQPSRLVSACFPLRASPFCGSRTPHSAGSLEFCASKLNSKLILVLGHTHCGALAGAAQTYLKRQAGLRNRLASQMEDLGAAYGRLLPFA